MSEKSSRPNFVLAADVGGTSARFACYKVQDGQTPQYLMGARFSSRTDNFAGQINQTLKLAQRQLNIKIRRACFAVAAVISADGNKAEFANLNWGIDCNELLSKTPLKKISLINDFEALGFGVNFLAEENKRDLIALPHPGQYYPKGNPCGTKAVIGPGTGLGHGILVYHPDENLYYPLHSEGSHADLAATNDLEWELVRYLRQNVCEGAHPDYERVASGPGLVNIYNFLRSREGKTDKAIDAAMDKAAAITANRANPLCYTATQMFLKFYAGAARNLAMACMATGGVYLGGGITPQILSFIQEEPFTEIFEMADRSTHRNVLREIPIKIIMNKRAALLGAAAWGG